jgi:tRNA nucleotidyltransferase (CCA-adding enzyme)
MKERLCEILMNDDVVLSIRNNFNELLNIIPEIKPMVNFPHNHPYHHLDVWEHTLYALSFAEKNFIIRLSLLLHDIGKPFTCTTDSDGINHFKGHPIKSYLITYQILDRLGFDDETIGKVCYLVKYHDEPINEEDIRMDLELTRLRYSIQYCDSLAHNPNVLYKREKYLDKTKILIDKHLAKH